MSGTIVNSSGGHDSTVIASLQLQVSTCAEKRGLSATCLQKAVALAPESESGHHKAATAVATAVRAKSGASASSHSSTGCAVPPACPAAANVASHEPGVAADHLVSGSPCSTLCQS